MRKSAKHESNGQNQFKGAFQFQLSFDWFIIKPAEVRLLHISFVSDFFGAFNCSIEIFVNDELYDFVELVALAYKSDPNHEELYKQTSSAGTKSA